MTIRTAPLRTRCALWALALAAIPTTIFPRPTQAQTSASAETGADALLDGFRAPPQVARPQVWWHLMNGNVAKEGMKLDLEWMARTGIGGVHAFSGAFMEPTVVTPPVPFMSDSWRDAFRYGVAQARSLGMELTIAGSPGWSQTGGPWVAPKEAMKKYVWTETPVKGGRKVDMLLAPLPQATGPFMAAPSVKPSKLSVVPTASGPGAVVAFRTPASQDDAGAYSVGGEPLPGLAGAPVDLSRAVPVPLGPDGATIDVRFPHVRTVSALAIASDSPLPFEVQASVDGNHYVAIGRYEAARGEVPAPQQTVTFAPVRAVAMRVVVRQPRPAHSLPGIPEPKPVASVRLRLLRFESGARVARFESKAGFQPVVVEDATPASATPGIDPAQVIDLSDRVGPDGRLQWDVPVGQWTVVRIGWTLTGQTNAPAEPEATGLEVDKLDRAAVTRYIDTYLAKYERDTGVKLGPDGVGGLLTDSWEAGVQNWTPSILADFRRLRGYDAIPWLPALAGHVVRDAGASDAFLADWRQTLKDLVIANHYGVLRDSAHRRGMTYYTEVQGDFPRAISDGLTAKGQSDIPTAEYWARPFTAGPGQPALAVDLKEAASAAHIYGRPLAAAESLTMAAFTDPWSTAPNVLKPVVDRIFALGINRILIHDSHHQPFVDRKPGLQLALFGQWFNRNETWAEQARPWSDYLARTSYLLQQGRYVADIAYLYGEERALTDIFQYRLNDDVPEGYGYDYIDAASVRDRLDVRDGAVVTPSGMAYRLLYLAPGTKRLSMDYARRLLDLVRRGAVLVGDPPQEKLGMAGSSAEYQTIIEQLWPASGTDIRVGKGRVLRGTDLRAMLATLDMAPDVTIPEGAALMTLHRRTDEAEIYFLSNQAKTSFTGTLRFRVNGMTPQWWSSENGVVRPLPFTQDKDGIVVPLSLEAEQAGFVLFRRDGAGVPRSVAGQAVAAEALALEGPWTVSFESGRGAPRTARLSMGDWSVHPDAGIRYFSGTATYAKDFSLSAAFTKQKLLLDLGDVRELASVRVNGKAMATAWHAPYRVDVSAAVRRGRNHIEIDVTNLWVNRLIGDRQPGAEKITYAPQSPYRANSPLRPSGLLGPILLVPAAEGEFAF